jgi:hypothetical protein
MEKGFGPDGANPFILFRPASVPSVLSVVKRANYPKRSCIQPSIVANSRSRSSSKV